MEQNVRLLFSASEELERMVRKVIQEAMQTMELRQDLWGERLEGILREFAERIEEKLGALAPQMEERHERFERRVMTPETMHSSSTESGRGQGASMEEFQAQGHSSTSQSLDPPTSCSNNQNLPVCTSVSMQYSSPTLHQPGLPATTFPTSTSPWAVPVNSSSDLITQSTNRLQALHYSTTSAHISRRMPSSSSTSLNVTQSVPLSMSITSSSVSITRGTGVSQTDSASREHVGRKLFWAVYRGNVEEVRRLLDAGADVNIHVSKFFGLTPLHAAARQGCTVVVNLLISAGADVNRGCPNGKSPLHFAAFKGRVEAIRTLINVGANANFPDENGCSPLHDAVLCKHVAPTRMLIQLGADKNLQTNLGNTPLHVAVLKNREKHAMEYISAGASLTIRNNEGESPLHCAARYSNQAIVQALAARTDSNLQTNEGNTPLHYAVRRGSLAALQALITAGELVNVQNADGETPLHWAVRGKNKTIVRLLIDAGASESIRDKFGRIPGDYA